VGQVDEQYDGQGGGPADDRAEGRQPADAAAAQDHRQAQGDDDRAHRHQHI
jgi:hypothetical protein